MVLGLNGDGLRAANNSYKNKALDKNWSFKPCRRPLLAGFPILSVYF